MPQYQDDWQVLGSHGNLNQENDWQILTEDKPWYEDVADQFTIPNAIRFGGSALGAVAGGLASGGLGTAAGLFGGGALGEAGARWWEGKEFDPTITALEGGLNLLPGGGVIPGKGAALKEIAKYGARMAGHGAWQGALGTYPRHQAERGNLWDYEKWETPSLGEFGGQTLAGGVIGGVTGGALGGANVRYRNRMGAEGPPPPRVGNPPQFGQTPPAIEGPEIGPYGTGEGQLGLYKPHIDAATFAAMRAAQPSPPVGQGSLFPTPSSPPPSPPSPIDVTPSPQGGLPQVVTPNLANKAEVQMYLSQGYVHVPGSSPLQMALPGYVPTPQVPTPTPTPPPVARPEMPSAIGQDQLSAGEVMEIPNEVVDSNPSYVKNMEKGGYKQVSRGPLTTIFRLFTEEGGGVSHEEIWMNLKRMLGRDPNIDELEAALRRQKMPHETGGLVADFSRGFEPEPNQPPSVPPEQLQNFLTNAPWRQEPPRIADFREAIKLQSETDVSKANSNWLYWSRAAQEARAKGDKDEASLAAYMESIAKQKLNQLSQEQNQIPWEGPDVTAGSDQWGPKPEIPPLDKWDAPIGGASDTQHFIDERKKLTSEQLTDEWKSTGGFQNIHPLDIGGTGEAMNRVPMDPRMRGRIEQVGLEFPDTRSWDLTQRPPVEQGQLMPSEVRQMSPEEQRAFNRQQDIRALRAEELRGEDWGETRQPEQQSMIPDFQDAEIAAWMQGQDTMIGDFRKNWGGLFNRFLRDESGSFDPEFWKRPERKPLRGDEEIPELAYQPDEGVASQREFSKHFLSDAEEPSRVSNPITMEEINQETQTAPEGRMNEIIQNNPSLYDEALIIYQETNPEQIVRNLARYVMEAKDAFTKMNEAQSNRLKFNIPEPPEIVSAYNRTFVLRDLAQAKYERAATRQLEGKQEGIGKFLGDFWKDESGTFDIGRIIQWIRQKFASPPSQPMDARAQLRAQYDAEMRARHAEWEARGKTLDSSDAEAVSAWMREGIESTTEYVRATTRDIESEGIRAKWKANRFLNDDSGEFDPEALWSNLRRILGRDPTDAELIEGMQRQSKIGGWDVFNIRDGRPIKTFDTEAEAIAWMDSQPNSGNLDYNKHDPNFDQPSQLSPLDEMRQRLMRDLENPPPPRPRTLADAAEELVERLEIGEAPELLIREIVDFIDNASDVRTALKNLGDINAFIDSVQDPNQTGLFEALHTLAFRKYHERIRAEHGEESQVPDENLDIFGYPKDRDLTQAEVDEIKDRLRKNLIDSYGEDVVEGQKAADEVDAGLPPEELAPGQRPGETLEQRNARWHEEHLKWKEKERLNALTKPLWRELIELRRVGYTKEQAKIATDLIENADKETAQQHVEALDEWVEEATKEKDFIDAGWMQHLRELALVVLRKFLLDDSGTFDWDMLKKGTKDLFQGVSERLKNPTAKNWAARVEELDARNAPDTAYRDIMSTAAKNPLKRGQTWRGRVIDGIKYFARDEQGATPIEDIKGAWKKVQGATGIGMGGAKSETQAAIKAFVKEGLQFPTNATTTMDFSAPGRQGLPLIFTGEFWSAARKMFPGAFPQLFDAMDAELRNKPIMRKRIDRATGKILPSVGEEIGIKIFSPASKITGTRAEGVASRWLENGAFLGGEKIPFTRTKDPITGKKTGGVTNPLAAAWKHTAGYPIRATNRAYITFLNQLNVNRTEYLMNKARDMSIEAFDTGYARPGIFKQKYTKAEALELNPYKNLVLGKEIAEFTNAATGHATAKGGLSLENAVSKIGPVLFSPGLLNSRIRLMNPATYVMATPFVRKQYAKAALSAALAWGATTYMARMAGAEVGEDETSADYGKIIIGNTRVDPGAGFLQFYVLANRMFTGGYTSSATGEYHTFGEGFQAETQLSNLLRFGSNKLNPLAKFAWDVANATEYQPFHVKDRLAQLFVPLYVQDIISIAYENPDMIPWLAPMLFGVGAQTYSKGESVGKLIAPENDWLVTGGGIADLGPDYIHPRLDY